MEGLQFFLSLIINISVFAVLISIVVDFVLYNNRTYIKKEKKSIVATGTMFLFYIVYYLVIRFEIRIITVYDPDIHGCVIEGIMISNEIFIFLCMIIGTLFIAIGAVLNVLGRLELKNNWANHIKIYEAHSLVTKGVYKIVRHPLYASIMLMFFGGSLVYLNDLSFLLTIFIFIPSMYYRAKQEEELLIEEFEGYEKYRDKVGMFFPKLLRKGE